MNKQEAISAMKQGYKVNHKFFYTWEYIALHPFNNKLYIDQENVIIEAKSFWKDRQDHLWNNGWKILYDKSIDPYLKLLNLTTTYEQVY